MDSIKDTGIRELSEAEMYFVSGAFSWESFAAATVAGAADVYDRHDYLEQMTPVYRNWWNCLRKLENGERKVVPLYRKTGN